MVGANLDAVARSQLQGVGVGNVGQDEVVGAPVGAREEQMRRQPSARRLPHTAVLEGNAAHSAPVELSHLRSTPGRGGNSVWKGRICAVLSNMPDAALVVSGGMKLAQAMGHAVPVHCRVALAATEVLSAYVAYVKIFGTGKDDSLLDRIDRFISGEYSINDLYDTAVGSVTAGMACIGVAKICLAASKTVEWAGRVVPKLYLLGGRLIRWTWLPLRHPLLEDILNVAFVVLGHMLLTVGRLSAWYSNETYNWENECGKIWREFDLTKRGSFQQHLIGCAKQLSAIGVVVAGGVIPVAVCTILQGSLGILQDTHRRMVVAA